MDYSKDTDLYLIHIWIHHPEYNDRDNVLKELIKRGYIIDSRENIIDHVSGSID